MKNIVLKYEIPLREIIYALLDSQKKRGIKGGGRLLKEVMAENYPSLGRDLDIWVHEAHRTSWKIFNPNAVLWGILSWNSLKSKKEFFKVTREKKKKLTTRQPAWGYQWISQQKTCRWGESGMILSKCWKKKFCQTRLLYPACCPPEMKGKSLSQRNKIWGSPSPLALPYKKYWTEFFKLSWHDAD